MLKARNLPDGLHVEVQHQAGSETRYGNAQPLRAMSDRATPRTDAAYDACFDEGSPNNMSFAIIPLKEECETLEREAGELGEALEVLDRHLKTHNFPSDGFARDLILTALKNTEPTKS